MYAQPIFRICNIFCVKICLKDPFFSLRVDIDFDLIEEPGILSIKKCIINAQGAVTAVENYVYSCQRVN